MEYQRQSGGMNEAYSDILGRCLLTIDPDILSKVSLVFYTDILGKVSLVFYTLTC